MEDEVYSDPLAELPVKNRKYVRSCKEIYLAKKNISKLERFEEFVNLEILWLNNNRIRKIVNLDFNIRIKKLYLQCNAITTLVGSLKCFTFLDTLNLSNNNLKDLNLCMEELMKLRYLLHLDLSGNPVAEETGYRLIVLSMKPSLKVLDCMKVTKDELRQAELVKITGIKKKKKRTNNSSALNMTMSKCTQWVEQEVRQLEKRDEEEAAKEREDLLKRANFFDPSRLTEGCPIATGIDFKNASKNRDPASLTEWEMYNLHQLFQTYDVDKNGSLSRDELRMVAEDMEDEGKELDGPSQKEAFNRFLEELDVNKDGKVTWKEFSEALSLGKVILGDEEGHGEEHISPPRWRSITEAQAGARSVELFSEADKAMQKFVTMDEDNSDRNALRVKALALSQKANRLKYLEETLAKKQKEQETKTGTKRRSLDVMHFYGGSSKTQVSLYQT